MTTQAAAMAVDEDPESLPPTRLAMRNVTRSFPGVRAVDDVSFEVRRGEVHALIGENGAGKSTLMHLVAGVYQPDSGAIELDGVSITNLNEQGAADAGIAMVYQERSLVGALSVAENVYAGRQPVNPFGVIRRAPMYDGTRKILADLEVEHRPADAGVALLSPGQQQMVEIAKGALARAQAAHPGRADLLADHQRGPAPLSRDPAPGRSGRRGRLCFAPHG